MARARRIDWIALGLGVSVLALVIAVFSVYRPAQVQAVEEAVFDQYQRWNPRPYRMEDPENPGQLLPPPPVVVIDIDEESLKQLGQWPWPRFYMAEMAKRLTEAGAAAIAFDVLFAEPDRTSPAVMIESYDTYGGFFDLESDALRAMSEHELPDHDEIFGWTISQTPVVMGFAASGNPQDTVLPPRPSGIPIAGEAGDITRLIEHFSGASPNLRIMSENAAGVGSIALSKEFGGIIRHVPLVVALADDPLPYPSLSIEALRVAQGASSHIIKTSLGSGESEFRDQPVIASMRVGAAVVPVDETGKLRVRYSQAKDERVIPAHKILRPGWFDTEAAAKVAGTIVFVGSSAPALFDIRRTPMHSAISGVHVHAEIVEQILAQDFLSQPFWSVPLERILIVVLGLAVILLLCTGRPFWAFAVLVVSLIGIAGFSWGAFLRENLLISPVAPLLGVALPHFMVSGYKYFTSEANRREITRQFEHFVSPDVISDIIDNPDQLAPGGAERQLSIMFLDVRRFSTITETMAPQEVIAFINQLLTPLTDAILEHEGTIDKYMGDAVMAFWNAPRQTHDHEIKAVRAMMAFEKVMVDLAPEFAAQGLPKIEIGVGINTGECSVGNMGSLKRLAYSCVGDAVNLASRLEGQTKAYGVGNLIGSATAEAVRGEFALIELDAVAVKGRSQPEVISTVAGDATVAGTLAYTSLAEKLAEARAAYLRQDWDGAEAAFEAASGMPPAGVFRPSALCQIMIERIGEYRAFPPPADWDGVYVATSK